MEQEFDEKNDRGFVETLRNYLLSNELYICICRNDNFIDLNKLTLKYQNAYKVLNNFITEDNNIIRLAPVEYSNDNIQNIQNIQNF